MMIYMQKDTIVLIAGVYEELLVEKNGKIREATPYTLTVTQDGYCLQRYLQYILNLFC
jgi:hypothetical protein